ncbi:TIGR02710 family CRISPR-associated CARF protein [Thermodesulforhabdus norvegica]|uniref:CRISPR-associated protein, TIGR02710 family n=1 Tax=Thermodesulforhabdus norvegica TaxID=39841 RepID=A0A1I4TA13_9BACT|nr:TIGR02710 family CRISPR-associated CARF protein [Thermodesulforhabdus norvegica]SFM73638.1 CRISPR-associated protein, TIGR02710 family [Thermodesulforhabdus norvegica]
MVKVLVLTVGGSCDPLVNAIKQEKPNFVYFLCSTGPKGSVIVVNGPGKPCKEREVAKPSIASQANLSTDTYEVVEIDDPDDLGACYRACEIVSARIQNRFGDFGNIEIVANYTGGTKTMSAALVLYALDSGWPVKFNVGIRNNLVKVEGGDTPTPIGVEDVLWKRRLETANIMISSYYYAEAQEILESLLRNFPVAGERKRLTMKCKEICRGFNLWDHFKHEDALAVLERFAGDVLDQFLFLKRILGRAKPVTGYETVVDLMLNAERRAAQRRYDDAVARLYRAVEMLAQRRLQKEYGIETGDVDPEKIPQSVREKYKSDEDGKIRIGLRMAYTLLFDLGDEVGRLFMDEENRIIDALKKRNLSILAHGIIPVDEATYESVSRVLVDFLSRTLDLLQCPYDRRLQFPRTMDFCFREKSVNC